MPQPSIAKVLTRKSKEFRGFGASKDYIERIEAAGSIRQFNLEIGHDAAKQMDDVWERAGRPKLNPVYHFVRSYIAEDLPHEQIWEDFEKSLSEIGWGDRQIIGAIHVDSIHIHVHGVGNRIHPITHEIWRPDGRERSAHANATGATSLFSLDGQRKIDPRAADFEIHTGQISMQRWGQEIVRLTIETELQKNTATWSSLIDVLGAQHGVTLEATVSPGKLPDNSILTLVAINGAKKTTLRLNGVDKNLTRESLEERFNEPFPYGRLPARLNTQKSYVTLREKYLLPTAQMQLPKSLPFMPDLFGKARLGTPAPGRSRASAQMRSEPAKKPQ